MIPCKDCLILPICRHKLYGIMMEECEKLRDFMYVDVILHPRLNRNMLLRGNRRDQTDRPCRKH